MVGKARGTMRVVCHTYGTDDAASGIEILLARVLGVSSDDLVVDAYGKPRLADDSAEISLSWVPRIAVLAVAEASVGIDVEPLRGEYTELDRLALERAVGAARADAWMAGTEPGADAGHRFSKVWTRLEAILKADGRGFLSEPRDNPDALEGWKTAHIDLGGFVGCVAAHEIPVIEVVQHQ